MREISALFNNTPNIGGAIRKAIEENAELKAQAEEYFQEKVNSLSHELLEKARETGGLKIVEMTGVRLPDVVKNVAFAVRRQSPEKTVFLGGTVDVAGKPLLTVMLTDDVVAQGHNASAIVREAAKSIKGGGGGQPGFAQAGGKDASGIITAFGKLKDNFL